jgi:hypothetical protein
MATKKKPTLPILVRKADKVFSEWIRKRDSVEYVQDEEGLSKRAGYCITCQKLTPAEGKGTGHAGHFIERGCKPTRYLERNVHLQCNYCNTYKYGRQYEYGLVLDARYGEGTAKSLYDLERDYKRDGYKYTREELENIINKYGGK